MIVTISKGYKEIVTGILLLLTITFYLFACMNLEYAFDNWCYSVYAGIVLTPITLYFCAGLEGFGKSPKNGKTYLRQRIVVPLMTFLTSLLFTIEGCLRMAHSFSAHKMIKSGWDNIGDTWWYYYENFHYAGSLLFFVSLISALFIGISFFNGYKAYRHKLVVKAEKKSKIEGKINSVIQRLKTDDAQLMAFDTHQCDESAQINVKMKNNIKKVPSVEKVTTSNDIIDNKNNVQQVDDVDKKPNQCIEDNSPETLEECFCDIILKRGTDILKDNSLLYILSSLYKDLDLSEYEDVITVMTKENFLCQFVEQSKQNDFALYNISSSFAHKQKINSQKCLIVTQALVNALKNVKEVRQENL